MVLRLRLARVATPGGSKRHAPIYNIVLAQARSARDSKPMEVLGVYDPIPKTPVGAEKGDRKIKDIKVDVSRAKYWLGVGAQPSDTVHRLLSMIGLLEPRYLPTGQHNEQALRAVRFPTHRPEAERKTADRPATERKSTHRKSEAGRKRDERAKFIYDNEAAGKMMMGAGTTSPMNPNEA